MSVVSTFSNAPNKTFFGLDRGGSHSFTVPTIVKYELIQYFDLKEGSLQKEITFDINGEEYPAEIRLGRVLNIRPHRRKDRKKTNVLKIQWAKFNPTKLVLRDKLVTIRNIILKGEKNSTSLVWFQHIVGNKFRLSFDEEN